MQIMPILLGTSTDNYLVDGQERYPRICTICHQYTLGLGASLAACNCWEGRRLYLDASNPDYLFCTTAPYYYLLRSADSKSRKEYKNRV